MIDPYVQAMAEASLNDYMPRVSDAGAILYVPQSQRVKIKDAREYARVDTHRRNRIFPEALMPRRRELVLTFRPSMARELEKAGCLDGARLIWSMWPGYLEWDPMSRFRESLDRLGIPLDVIHASGHATVGDLQRLARALEPDCVVPIHTAAPERFPALFDNVELRADGEWWEV